MLQHGEYKVCTKCVMTNQRPGITFNEEGVCKPCQVAEERKKIDWDARWKELEKLCNKHRGDGTYYDCAITGSGGKDSHFQVHVLKDLLGMNPLLLNIYNYSWTDTGMHNFLNWSEAYDCDVISLILKRGTAKIMTRLAFEHYGSPTLYWDRAVYSWPVRMAHQMEIPLLIYGENISYEYGGAQEETPSAAQQINNEAVPKVDPEEWIALSRNELSKQDFITYEFDPGWLKFVNPQYLSYYVPWDGRNNAEIARRHGFRTLKHEWTREGFIEDYDQIDTAGYLVHPWLKYPKYGHARVTDIASLWVRLGYINRGTAVNLVKMYEGQLDQHSLDDFLVWTGYTDREFWQIVDQWYNEDIFEYEAGVWRHKFPIK